MAASSTHSRSEKSSTDVQARRGGGRAAMAAGGTAHNVRLGRAFSNLKRRREPGPGELRVNLDQALRAAKEGLEALREAGRAEEMKSEELDGLGLCAVAVLQLVESGKDSVKKRQQAALVQEREARAAKEAASAAELRRLEKEIAELKESLASERKAAHSQRCELAGRGEEIMHLTSDLRRLVEENADLEEKLASEREKAGQVSGLQYWIMDLASELERTEQDLSGRGHEVMDLLGEVKHLESQLECSREEVRELVANREMLREDLEAEKEKGKCRICFARARNTVILPCSHFQFCNRCLQQHRERATTCPTCRVPITGTMDLYVS